MKGFDPSRRTFLKGIGATAIVGGAGVASLSSSAAAASVHIGANSPATVRNARGDLSRITIDPTFRVEWDNFDTAVGKLLFLVEAKNHGQSNYTPVFRMTPWLTQGTKSVSGVDLSKPGTSGYYQLNARLSDVIKRGVYARGNLSDAPRELPRPIEVVNEDGRPDYENADYSNMGGVDADSYLDGTSLGGAGQAEDELVDKGGLKLVNNFPGVDGGYYGAASDTTYFDQETDGKQKTRRVDLRYTVALLSVNQSMLGDGTPGEGWFSDVKEDEVSPNHSVLVMNGEDGYGDVTAHGASGPDEKLYSAYQAIASNHPAVMTSTPSFDVTVKNKKASSGVTGNSHAGAN